VIQHPDFTMEPWCLREATLDLGVLAQSESLFALSNGHIGWRGNLDEGAPVGLSGSYLNGVYERRPLPYAEAGFGYPESGESVINVTDGKLIRLLVNDEPFDMRYGQVREHERVLDFRAGVLRRRVEWESPADCTIRVTSTRLVSLTQRSVAAIEYEVEAVDTQVRLVIQSELVANEPPPSANQDPRVAAVLDSPLRSEDHYCDNARVGLVHRTEHSGLLVAAAMDHVVGGPVSEVLAESFDDLGRVSITATLQPGERLRLIKFVTYGWSAERSRQAMRDQVDAALTAARLTGWEGLLAEQKAYLDHFWERADVEVDGDGRIQQAVRFGLFHVLQAGARAEGRAIPAKGLTGTGYEGHAFWDTETFVLPVLTYTIPDAARYALTWRHSTLPMALERAEQFGLRGAAFPWRTISGLAGSSYWPAGTAAFHIGADIADAVVRYLHATGNSEFERTVGLELLVQTARLWQSLGHYDSLGRFRIDGVTGPDEYSAIADNNVYTNLMAQHNLRSAANVAKRNHEQSHLLGVDEQETAAWLDAADAMTIPFDETLGVHQQSEGFTSHQLWDFAATREDQYPLLLHFPYFDLYRKQVLKQADLVLAMHLRGEAFTLEQKAANFDYYERLTVRDSSLSACTQAVMAAELGHLDLAYDYLAEAALMDLDNLERNTRDGLHIASLAGSWIALVAGFGGMRERDGSISFAPRLPPGLKRLAFCLVFLDRHLQVETTPEATTYRLTVGDELTIYHFGEATTVSGTPVVCKTPPLVSASSKASQPRQPAGRPPLFQDRHDQGQSSG
jgi:alpha,alpha-trehalose phosphorylase